MQTKNLVIGSISAMATVTGIIAMNHYPDDVVWYRAVGMFIVTVANFAYAVKYLSQYLTTQKS